MNDDNSGLPFKRDNREVEVVVFGGKRMRKRAEELLSQGVYEATWMTLRGEPTRQMLYIVPVDEINEEYLSGFEKLFNFIRDKNENYGIFLGNRNEEGSDKK